MARADIAGTPRAGIVKRWVVYSLAVLVIACLPVITLGGAEYQWPRGVKGGWYEHGWPWKFSSRFCSRSESWFHRRVAFWKGRGEVEFKRLQFAGDIGALAGGVLAVVLLPRRLLRMPGLRLSLAQSIGLVTLACIGSAYVAYHRHLCLKEEKLTDSLLFGYGTGTYREYCGPRWLVQLWGDSELFDAAFVHYTYVTLGDPAEAKHIGVLASQLKYLHGVKIKKHAPWNDQAWADFMQARKRWSITKLYLEQSALGDDALAELHRYPGLEVLVMRESNIGDAGLRYLKDCPRLKEVWFSEHISDRGLQDLQLLQQLEFVSLENAGITDAGIAAIVICPRLTVIRADGTQVTVNCVSSLRNAEHLRVLSLVNCRLIKESDWQEFEELHLESLIRETGGSSPF